MSAAFVMSCAGFMRRTVIAAAALALFAVAAPASAIQVQEITSPGGIKAWLVEDHSIPLLSLSLAFRGGSVLDPEGKDGTSQLVAGLQIPVEFNRSFVTASPPGPVTAGRPARPPAWRPLRRSGSTTFSIL